MAGAESSEGGIVTARRPAYQWYPGDFRRDPGVQAVSFDARGLWREMLDLMHSGEPYGYLTTANGERIDVPALAKIVGIAVPRCQRLYNELKDKGIFNEDERGIPYSRRMVRDEHNRLVRAAGGAKSLENPSVPRPKASSVWQPALEQALANRLTTDPGRIALTAVLATADDVGKRGVVAEITALLDGQRGAHLRPTPAQMDQVLSDYTANGMSNGKFNAAHFRKHVERAMRAPAAPANGPKPSTPPTSGTYGKHF